MKLSAHKARAGLLFVTMTAGVLFGWFVGTLAPSVGSADQSAARPRSESIEPDGAPGLSAVRSEGEFREVVISEARPIVEEDTRPTVWDAFEILDQSIGSSSEGSIGPEYFEQRYQGATKAQILIAHAAAEAKMERERTRISAELLEQGKYRETLQEAGDPSPFPRTSPERPVVSFGFHIEYGDGFARVRTAEIDPLEYPEFHAIEQEYHWLASKAAKLKKEH